LNSKIEAAYSQGYEYGIRAERERIATRQVDAGECPPEYNVCRRGVAGTCKKCWLDWLEPEE